METTNELGAAAGVAGTGESPLSVEAHPAVALFPADATPEQRLKTLSARLRAWHEQVEAAQGSALSVASLIVEMGARPWLLDELSKRDAALKEAYAESERSYRAWKDEITRQDAQRITVPA